MPRIKFPMIGMAAPITMRATALNWRLTNKNDLNLDKQNRQTPIREVRLNQAANNIVAAGKLTTHIAATKNRAG